jgi:tyrosine-protein kinase Etk/Wzc
VHDETPAARRTPGPVDEASAPPAITRPRPELRAGLEITARAPLDGQAPALSETLHVIAARWRTAAAFAAAVLAFAGLYLFAADPTFAGSVLLQVEDRREAVAGKADLFALLGRTPVDTEIRLLRSRAILGAVAAELGLELQARPVYLPLLGRGVARRREPSETPATAPWGLEAFAWGGERIRLERLQVPEELLDEPLTLTALGGGGYRLASGRELLVAAGAVGAPAVAVTSRGRIELLVTELAARPGTQFDVVRRDPAAVAAQLAQDLQIQESGGTGRTGILEVALEGPDPREVTRILNAIAETWVRQHAAAGRQALEFARAQLAALGPEVRQAELALSAFRRDAGAVNLSQQTAAVVTQAADVEKELSVVAVQRAVLTARGATDRHPDVLALDRKAESLRARRAALDAQLRGVPGAEVQAARLARQAKVVSELHDQILSRAEELRMARPGLLEGVRIVDPAVPPRRPVRPRPALVLSGALLLSITGGIAAALARAALRNRIEGADDVERHGRIPVYAVVPRSREQARLARRSAGSAVPPLASALRADRALEALRSLRTALDFALIVARSNVVAVASPGPGAGRSFVAANLAVLAAQAGRRVLLVDADLRRGSLHQAFGLPRGPGLTDAITGGVPVDAAPRATAVSGLDLMCSGPLPPNPADLLATQRFGEVVTTAARRYDLVLLDTAPILGVADGAIAASHAGVNLLVLRAGRESSRDLAIALERLAQAGTTVQGAILNDVQRGLGPRTLAGPDPGAGRSPRPWRRPAARPAPSPLPSHPPPDAGPAPRAGESR